MQGARRIGHRELDRPDRDARRLFPKVLQQRRQEHDLADIGHDQRVDPALLSRGEFAAVLQALLNLRQGTADDRTEPFGERRRQHAAGRPHEQTIPEMLSQTADRVARSRLRQTDRSRGLRYALELPDRVEDGEEVEIEIGIIHVMNIAYF